jgi:hypothetical protein
MQVPLAGGTPAGTQYGPCVALPPHHPQPEGTQTSLNAKLHCGTSSRTEQYSLLVRGSKTQLQFSAALQVVIVEIRSQAVQEDWFDPCITHFPSAPHHVHSGVSEHANGVTIDSQY